MSLSYLIFTSILYFVSLFHKYTVNLMGCLWWWIAEVQGLQDSWVATTDKIGIDLFDAQAVQKWLVSIYFATTTITTIGYGDITPQTTMEVLVAIVFMLAAVSYFGYLLS